MYNMYNFGRIVSIIFVVGLTFSLLGCGSTRSKHMETMQAQVSQPHYSNVPIPFRIGKNIIRTPQELENALTNRPDRVTAIVKKSEPYADLIIAYNMQEAGYRLISEEASEQNVELTFKNDPTVAQVAQAQRQQQLQELQRQLQQQSSDSRDTSRKFTIGILPNTISMKELADFLAKVD